MRQGSSEAGEPEQFGKDSFPDIGGIDGSAHAAIFYAQRDGVGVLQYDFPGLCRGWWVGGFQSQTSSRGERNNVSRIPSLARGG